jgi:bifunctional UDP-N-acetylglucosamine pyrophosphorylase/glucosamine-1-phosphate N-acetyltransferase
VNSDPLEQTSSEASDRVALIVLAAGAGKRMKSALPKPLHPVGGIPMIERVLRAGSELLPVSKTIVVSPALVDLPSRLNRVNDVKIAVQEQPLGTGHAVLRGLAAVGDVDWVVVLFADTPLLTGATLVKLVARARHTQAFVTMLTCKVDDAAGYGRIDRDTSDRPLRIVERAADDPSKRQGRVEINSGMMVLRMPWALTALHELTPNPMSQEIYLTDLVERAISAVGEHNDPWPVVTVAAEIIEAQGVNDRVELSRADEIVRARIRHRHMLNGVTILAPESVLIDDDVVIGQDTTIFPATMLQGTTIVGVGCTLGPQTTLMNASLGNRVAVRSSTIAHSSVGDDSDVGPYAHLRGGTLIGDHVHVGNFAEMKNAVIDADVKVGHVSYLGDVHVGSRTNIGAGTITCNFDGNAKHHTEIGADVFIGSDTMLVAPLTIESGASTGAGAVVTRDVAAGTTVVGVPARRIKRRTDQPVVEGDSVQRADGEQ